MKKKSSYKDHRIFNMTEKNFSETSDQEMYKYFNSIEDKTWEHSKW